MKNKFTLLFISLLFSFIILEIILNFAGFKPAQISYSKWTKKVDTLEKLKGFTTDSLGIFKVDTQYLYQFQTKDGNFLYPLNKLYKDNYVREIFTLRDEFIETNLDNNFTRKVNNLKNEVKTDLDSAILNYINVPINSDGFHSIAFKEYKTKKTKVLLIGDSFTWGHSTSNKSFSFANELLAKDYIVYNTGISGADATQYKAIAEKYIPILKPDIVILNFFMGNDISYYKRELKPYQPIFYSTNAGNLMSNQNGIEYATAQEAYDNIMKASYMPTNTLVRKIASKTVISTFAWIVWWKIGLANYQTPKQFTAKKHKKPTCNQEIQDIVAISKKHQARFELIAIPDFLYNQTKVQDFPYLFENIEYKMSPVLEDAYKMSDGHFNEKGHLEYADFLDKLIKYKK